MELSHFLNHDTIESHRSAAFIRISGVKSIDTDVDAKSVVVEADDSVTPSVMLEKLEKVLLSQEKDPNSMYISQFRSYSSIHHSGGKRLASTLL